MEILLGFVLKMKINKKAALLIFSLLLVGIAFLSVGGVEAVAKVLPLFNMKLMMIVTLLFLGTVVLSFVRIWIILQDFGHKLNFIDVVKACVAGNIGALFFIPVFGQIAGRQFYLAKLGVSTVENSAASGYERVMAGGVSAFFAFAGFLYIYDWGAVEGANLINLFIFAVSVVVTTFVFYRRIISSFEKQIIKKFISIRNVFLLLRIVFIVALGMVLMMMCFVLMFGAALPEVDYLKIVSVAFIVSFLASLPISFGGWGLREVSSMFFVAYLGGVSEAGLAASVFIGLISMAVVLMFYPILFVGKRAA